ncbi:MAG: ABC transporter ATP-binding protein [Deltaproteobacteria bacterium]|nr:ABC transporter ATP-binding protein [Deltaproteobacteria bacterium]
MGIRLEGQDRSEKEDRAGVLVDNLSKSFPTARGWLDLLKAPFGRGEYIKALDGIDFTVRKGSALAVLGPNGAGKSTLLKVLSGLVEPDSGRAMVMGLDVKRQTDLVQKLIGFAICDERSFYWRLSAWQNIEFFAMLQDLRGREKKERVNEVLEKVHVSNEAKRPFRDLSTGIKQRLALARALLNRPKVLLVDEPTRSLDPGSAAGMRKFLKQDMLENEKITLIMATHDLEEASEVADQVLLLKKGTCAAFGEVEQVMPEVEKVFGQEEW